MAWLVPITIKRIQTSLVGRAVPCSPSLQCCLTCTSQRTRCARSRAGPHTGHVNLVNEHSSCTLHMRVVVPITNPPSGNSLVSLPADWRQQRAQRFIPSDAVRGFDERDGIAHRSLRIALIILRCVGVSQARAPASHSAAQPTCRRRWIAWSFACSDCSSSNCELRGGPSAKGSPTVRLKALAGPLARPTAITH